MATALLLFAAISLLLLLSLATSCDRCVHRSKATTFALPVDAVPFSSSDGACGYGSTAVALNGGFFAAGSPAVFRAGVGCGACFQVRCKHGKLCDGKGVKVVLTDSCNGDDGTHFVLSGSAFAGLARNATMAGELRRMEQVDIEYKRVPCEYKSKNLTVSVDRRSKAPANLVVKFLFQGGQTDIMAVDVAQLGSSIWRFLVRVKGSVWSTTVAPQGPLQFRLVVTGGYDGKWVWAEKEVLPANWQPGAAYDMGIQIDDVAQESCYPCDAAEWS